MLHRIIPYTTAKVESTKDQTSYEIVVQTNYDEYGHQSSEQVYVRWKKSFLGLFTYYKYHTKLTCFMGDCFQDKVNFDSVEHANKFIQNILCKQKPFNTTVLTTKETKCNCIDNKLK